MIKRKLKKLLEILRNIVKAGFDEIDQIQREDLFIHNWKGGDKK